jgi:hypothetical protein
MEGQNWKQSRNSIKQSIGTQSRLYSCTPCKEGRFQDDIQEANCKGMLSFLKTFLKNRESGFGILEFWNLINHLFFLRTVSFFVLFQPSFCFKIQQIVQQDCTRLKLVLPPALFALDAHKVGIRRRLV